MCNCEFIKQGVRHYYTNLVVLITNLDGAVPPSRHNDGVSMIGRESHARHPVTVSIILNGVLALSKGVPQLDGLVPRTRDNLSVVYREGHGEDILRGKESKLLVERDF